MNALQNLTGRRILIVEDDYLLAWDTGDALCKAGAEIVGPVANEDDALAAIRRGNLHAAVTDINLGCGPSFETARALQSADIPFVFLTGYDQLSIPEEFHAVPRLTKPIDAKQIARELTRVLK